MNAVPFDTLKLARALRDNAGFPPAQAEAAAVAIADAIQTDLATKTDLALAVADINLAIADIKTSIEGLNSKIADTQTNTIKWVVGIIAFAALLQTAVALLHHS